MVSIKDVARHAGVAISTVSKVINSYPNVSDETRGRVNKAVEELNFLPNSVAAALSSKKAGRVALLVNINAKTQAIDEISLQYIQDKSVEELIRYLMSQSISGIIIYGISRGDQVLLELIEREHFKCVVIDAPIFNESTSSVWIDHASAQYDVAKRTVVDNNCRRILYISGRENVYVTEEKLSGMRKLAEEMNLNTTVKCGDLSDLMAIGAMKALTEMDIFRPVCGFDGIILMGYVGKQMNTVRQNFAGISAAAMEELQKLMNGKEGENVRMPYSLERMKYMDIIC